MKSLRVLLLCLLSISISTMLLLRGRLSSVKADATCSTNSTPSLNGQHWADSGQKNVYIDPKLPPQDQAQIRQAISDFASQTGQNVVALPDGSPCPNSNQQNSISFMNNAAGSPTSFAHTSSTVQYDSSGNPTSNQISTITSFNYGAQLPNGSPYYDANQPNAAQYIYDVTLHELGHSFGLNDAPVPVDAQGNPDYSQQPAGASIMNGGVNTNDQGPHQDANGNVVQGGIGGHSVQPCDKQQISSANPVQTASSDPSQSGDPGTSSSSDGGDGGTTVCTSWDEWDDETNTLTNYTECM